MTKLKDLLVLNQENTKVHMILYMARVDHPYETLPNHKNYKMNLTNLKTIQLNYATQRVKE